jgi:phage FluMu protein Com
VIVICEGASGDKVTKPIGCPRCTNKRVFDVPAETSVRKSRRGNPAPHELDDVLIIKCKKCSRLFYVYKE